MGLLNKDIPNFYRQLATLNQSGMSLTRCLGVLERQCTKQQKKMIHTLRNRLDQGMAFSQAVEGYPIYFSTLEIKFIQVGELSGSLDRMLNTIADTRDQEIRLKDRILNRLLYPAFIFHVALIIKLVISWFLLNSSKIWAEIFFGITIFYGPISLAFVFPKVCLYLPCLVGILHSFLYRMPFIGELITTLDTIRFTSSLRIMINAGSSMVKALEMALVSTTNSVIKKKLTPIPKDVKNGLSLHLAMTRTGVFSARILDQISTGEESGKTVKMLEKISQDAQIEANLTLDHLGKIIPAAIYFAIMFWITNIIFELAGTFYISTIRGF